MLILFFFFFFQAEDGIRDLTVTGVQTCALPIFLRKPNGPIDPRLKVLVGEPRASRFERHLPVADRIRTWSHGERIADAARRWCERGDTTLRHDTPRAARTERGETRIPYGPELGRAPVVRTPLVHDDRGTIAPRELRRGKRHRICNEIGDVGWWSLADDRRRRIETGGVPHIQRRPIPEKLVCRAVIVAA